ncbi:hypothetical protein HU200_061148 [Digitaria exilis]|uniref:Dirigent protein n=1 Tax=Digitaria exilis TaxID=1010633 RepID=A0A835E1L1_9POAL|nr:hypothetical protein HU200_061148 [Digitaria exilis]CAB3482485.1 unnamed protein product [Digitaria exilis]
MASYYAIVVLSLLAACSISGGHALDENTLQTTLYIKQSFSTDQRTVAKDTVIINWVIKDGPDATANTTGHAEGLTTHSNLSKDIWVTLIDMVFEGGRLAGSTLKVMGLHGSRNDGQGQWSVMGGTGELTMARGVINYKIIQEDTAGRIFEIRIFVYYTAVQST